MLILTHLAPCCNIEGLDADMVASDEALCVPKSRIANFCVLFVVTSFGILLHLGLLILSSKTDDNPYCRNCVFYSERI